ncbi:GlsB/YeaQ/YmgE family stress response membrane protein [Peptostreptococcus equinus]|uniref:GlsB/YeaQ/YmgE family stress response membrane protein n=1 Tax=Peptostreptococcus equinus TaxID=3003601 RepID=A0ABY7JMC9_9FIRM|nr:GlsB/YeaQ/YmgE family stress response membrane protein [Peptostreptococcus sp. CBA3647]WAW14487.1 GlsB/YeaQ/YmgE family stress response membrane protein [Peptostreptococcus sp. CBA3647]
MGIISWLIVGALAGWLGSIIMGKNAQMGAIANIIVGIIGAFIGGFIAQSFGGSGVSGINLYSIAISVLGAVVLLFIVGLIQRKR